MERLNITLDAERSAKLVRLADRMHVQPGSLARSLLPSAIDEAGPDARNVADGIPGALERERLGLEHARACQTAASDEL